MEMFGLPKKARTRKGILSLEMFQAIFILLAVLLLLLGSSLKVKEKLEDGGKRQAAAMLALQIAGKLDSFHRNACGGGFCYATFIVAERSSNLAFLPDGVVVMMGGVNATAHTSFPLDSLDITVEDLGGESRITTRGFG